MKKKEYIMKKENTNETEVLLSTIKYEGRPITTYVGKETSCQLVNLVDALLEAKEKEIIEKCAAVCDSVSEEYSGEVESLADKTPAKTLPSFWKLSGSFACAMKIRQANRERTAHKKEEADVST